MAHRVAIIADAHVHDPTGDFRAGLMVGGRRLALRSWRDTENGPRAVNETAAVLTAALDRITAAGIRHVILAGDYTDDGQAENTRALARLLARHGGLRFYAIPGNHDLFGPHGKHVTTRLVTGPQTTAVVTSDPDLAPDAIVTAAMRCEGQPAALLPMARFGLFRQPEDLHWESPFGPSDAPADRMYDATAADGSVTHRLMDASYLVEPEPGLWILMIDANVFEPRPGRSDPTRKKAFLDPSDAGWTALLRIKPFILPWIADVVARAKGRGKTLVTVSHYPVLDPFQDRDGSEAALFGETPVVRRTPAPAVAKALIATGLRWHAGGHLHVNAVTQAEGLTDIAIPSLAAFPPAFRIITATPDSAMSETVLLDDLPPDPDLQAAYAVQGRTTPPMPYGPFLAAQFRAHIITRVLPRQWPPDLFAWTSGADCADLLIRLGPGDATDFAGRHGLPPAALGAYPLTGMIADAYLIRTAGPLSRGSLDPIRLRICQALAQDFGDAESDPQLSQIAFIRRFLSVLQVSVRRMGTIAHPADQGPCQGS
jgi:3',5'-cyclic AMP phosphodiesterase CpdA